MKKIKFLILLILVFSANVFAQENARDYVWPNDLVLTLPADKSVKNEWVAPPLSADIVAKANLKNTFFRVDRDENIWICQNQKILTNLNNGFSFTLNKPIHDFTFMDDGALFIVTDKTLGFVPAFKAENLKPDKGVFILPFQPLCDLPLTLCRIFSDRQDRIFISGYDPVSRTYELHELISAQNQAFHPELKNLKGWRELFVSAENISAVAADKTDIYLAVNKTVYKIIPGKKDPEVVFIHPEGLVFNLEVSEDASLFFTVPKGVGVMKNKLSLEFLKSAYPQIGLRNKKLFVFFPGSLGVLSVSNLDKFIDYKPKTSGK